MPSSICYDPSLVLASVVSDKAVASVEAIADEQAKPDAAEENLNALVASRRSLDMTRKELINLGINVAGVDSELALLDGEITGAAREYAAAKIKAEKVVKKLRAQIRSVHVNVESPVDYVKTQIKSMPLAVDSINMDVQYFSLDTNAQSSAAFAASVGNFVSASMSFLGNKVASQMSSSAQSQISAQTSNHSIDGTLVLSVSCTHKNASILAPCVLNVDKGIKVWNSLFLDDKLMPTDRISTTFHF